MTIGGYTHHVQAGQLILVAQRLQNIVSQHVWHLTLQYLYTNVVKGYNLSILLPPYGTHELIASP